MGWDAGGAAASGKRERGGAGLACWGLFFCLATAFTPLALLGADTQEPTEAEIQTVLDDSPFISARAAGMGGALSTLADGVHAPFYNPAGIGGLHWERQRPPFVRQLHFPYLGAGANEEAMALQSEFKAKDGAKEKAVGQGIVDAQGGKRQYARASGLFSIVMSRFTLLQYSDMQFAAFRKTQGELEEDSTISAAFRSQSGAGMGFSVSDPKETLYLGAFSSLNQRQQFKGDFGYYQLVRKGERRADLNPQLQSYEGLASNMGMIWVMGKYGRPTLALVNKNVGTTRYRLKKAASSQETSGGPEASEGKMVEPENVTIGFSLSPHVGRAGAFNFIVEAQHLTEKEVALNKKFRSGLELNLGGFGSDAVFGLRAGYSLAGASVGANINLGLIQLEAASQAEDIGIGNRHKEERRNFAVFSVNVLAE